MSAATTLDVEGELTIHTAAEQWPSLLGALEKGTTLRIGLAGVTELDTAGLQQLLAARHEAVRLGGEVEFVDPSEPVLEALAIVNLDGGLRPVEGEAS